MLTTKIDEHFLIEHIDRSIEAAKDRVEDPNARLQITLPLFTVRSYLVASSDLKEIDAIPMDTATRRKAEGKRS